MQTNIFYCYQGGNADAPDLIELVESLNLTAGDMVDINAEGGLKCWEVPSYTNRRHYAWNPITFRSRAFYFAVGEYADVPADAEKYEVTIAGQTETIWFNTQSSERVELVIYNDANEPYTLVADELRGVATFNVAPVVRNWFADKLPETGFVVEDTTALSLFKTYGMAWGSTTTYATYYIQNAVSQTGSDGNKKFNANICLNDIADFYCWNLTPSVLPVVSVLINTATTINLNWGTYNLKAKTAYIFRVDTPEDFAVICDLFGGTDLHFVENYTSVCQPCFLRWRNRKGGYDTHLFTGRFFKTKKSKTTGTRDVYGDNTGDMATNVRPYAVEGDRLVRCGADSVTDFELDYLTRLPYSPLIEWYDVVNELWTEVMVEDFSHEEQSDAITHPFEITLRCPNINMQFE